MAIATLARPSLAVASQIMPAPMSGVHRHVVGELRRQLHRLHLTVDDAALVLETCPDRLGATLDECQLEYTIPELEAFRDRLRLLRE